MTTARTAVPALAKNDVYSLLHPHACTTADNASRKTQRQLVATFGISPQEACPHYPCMANGDRLPAEATLTLPQPTRCAAGSRLASAGTPLRARPTACVSAHSCGHHDCAVGGQLDAAARPHSTGMGTVHTDAHTTRRTSAKADGASHVPPAA